MPNNIQPQYYFNPSENLSYGIPSQPHSRHQLTPIQPRLIQHHPRLPVQMVSPIQQSQEETRFLHRPHFPEQRFILLDNGPIVGGNYPPVNTHVVATNQGLRMVAHQRNIRMQRQQFNSPENITNNCFQMQRPPALLNVLPKLKASISASEHGIILTWDYESNDRPHKYKPECYQLFAYQARDMQTNPPLDIRQWKKIGVVKALPLPMACTLTQFARGNVYHFAVVGVDIHGRESEMSNPCIIRLNLHPRNV